MTGGWQGNEGGYGGWNQPQGPYGADPNQGYGVDPYGGQQADPYGGQQYGSPYGGQQYGQYGQTAQYPQTAGYPAGGYQGFGGPPPPQKRSKAPIIFSVLAIVLVVGAVVTIVLINRGGEDTAGGGGTQSSTEAPPTTGSSAAPSSDVSDPPTSGSEPPDTGDWQTVPDTGGTGLTHQVPADWELATRERASGIEGIEFAGGADFGRYSCGGGNYIRTFTATGNVKSKDGGTLDVGQTITDFAEAFAKNYYRDTAQVDLPTPEPTTVGDRDAATLIATVTPEVTNPECDSTSGQVAIVGVEFDKTATRDAGVAMLVVVSDVSGGPSDPVPVPESVVQQILTTVALSS